MALGLQSQLEDDGTDGLVEIISAGGLVCAVAHRRARSPGHGKAPTDSHIMTV